MGAPYAELIGDPVEHSKSPAIHKYWLEKLGIDGDYRAVRVPADQLPAYLAERRSDETWRGCNVTMPHKQAVIPLLDVIADPGIGAVNCVVPEAGRLEGRNTDVGGFLAAIAPAHSAMRRPVNHLATCFHVIGAGGAARAVAAAVRGHDVDFFNRDATKARALADEFGPGSAYGYGHGLDGLGGGADHVLDPAYSEVRPNSGIDQRYSYIIVNASSMGMTGMRPVPIDLRSYPENTLVVDLVYDPLETPLLAEARRLGMATIDGLAVLIAQARFAFECFFGIAPPEGDAELRIRLTS